MALGKGTSRNFNIRGAQNRVNEILGKALTDAEPLGTLKLNHCQIVRTELAAVIHDTVSREENQKYRLSTKLWRDR